MEMSLFLLGIAVALLLLDLWALNSIWRTTKPSGTKLGWTVLILIFPLVGVIIWGIVGPRGVAQPPTSKEHSKG